MSNLTLNKTDVSKGMVYRVFFLGLNVVSGLCTYKPKRP